MYYFNGVKNKLLNDIIYIESKMFHSVKDKNGPTSCQKNNELFNTYRFSQLSIWSVATLRSYLEDLKKADENHINLITIKYARMMQYTNYNEYIAFANELPILLEPSMLIIDKIRSYFIKWNNEFKSKYPNTYFSIRKNSCDSRDKISSINYLICELSTFSFNTLKLCLKDIEYYYKNNINAIIKDVETQLKIFKFNSITEYEKYFSKK